MRNVIRVAVHHLQGFALATPPSRLHFLKPFPSYFHENEPLIKYHPSFSATSA